MSSLEGVWESADEVCRYPPLGDIEEQIGLLRALEPGRPQQGIDIFFFAQALLGLAGVRQWCGVSGKWLADTRVAFCQPKIYVHLIRAPRSRD